MNQNALEMLKRLYGASADWIIITDGCWNPVWSTRKDVSIPNLRCRLLMTGDGWESAERPLLWEDALYYCTVLGSEADGLRVVVLRPVLRDRFDLDLMSSILQSMIVSCSALFHELDDTSAKDMRGYLNRLMSGVLRIYRMTYLEKEVRRGAAGQWDVSVFGLQSVIQPIFEETRNLLRSCAHVTYECGERTIFLRGDLTGFRTAVLAALVMCVRKPEFEQNIRFELHREGERPVLTITVHPETELRHGLQGQLIDFGDLSQEKFLLNQYCAAFGVHFSFTEQDDTVTFRMESDPAQPDTLIQFRSPSGRADGSYFDPIPVILARIRFRDYF